MGDELAQFSGHRTVVRFQRQAPVSVVYGAAALTECEGDDCLKMALQQGDLPDRLCKCAQIRVRLDECVQVMGHGSKIVS